MEHSYRNRIDIIESILDVANGNDVRQGKILQKAKITHAIFKEYIPLLIQCDLIEYLLHEGAFKTTIKGLDFLTLCNKMKALLLSPPEQSNELLIPMISENK
jgi:predicted transcriptional regulator